MRFYHTNLDTCTTATGLVVAIDVIRAFTMAAFAFDAGAALIYLVGSIEDAWEAKKRLPDALMMGEVGGRIIPGFDYGNSPSAILGKDLGGRRVIQRTGAGTQGIVRSGRADVLLAASFVCASATVRYIQSLAPDQVTFVITGYGPDGRGDEDQALADYLEAHFSGLRPDSAPYLERVRASRDASYLLALNDADMPFGDLALCVDLDRFPFAMRVERQDGLFVMKAVFS